MAEEPPVVEALAVARVGLVTLATGTNTGWTCTLPATQAGDVAFTFIAKRATGNPTTVPAGYVLLDPQDASGGSAVFLSCYAKVLAAGDSGASHVWAWASTTAGASCLILRGVDNAVVLDVADPPAAATTNSTTVACPASNAPNAGDWVVWATAVGTNATHAFPASNNGNTVTREVGSTAGANGLAWATYPTATAVSALTATFSVSGRTLGKTLVVRPAGLGPVTQRWSGGAWVPAAVQRWTGSAWVAAQVRRWNGTSWV